MAQLIDYIFEPKKLQLLTENVNGHKVYKVRGVFQRADEKNANGRLYPLKVLESQVKYLDPKIRERALVGATDHPECNSTLKRSIPCNYKIMDGWPSYDG